MRTDKIKNGTSVGVRLGIVAFGGIRRDGRFMNAHTKNGNEMGVINHAPTVFIVAHQVINDL